MEFRIGEEQFEVNWSETFPDSGVVWFPETFKTIAAITGVPIENVVEEATTFARGIAAEQLKIDGMNFIVEVMLNSIRLHEKSDIFNE